LLVKKRYHLAPTKSFVGHRPYRALAEAMRELDVVALTRFAQWSTEQLGAISSRGIVLELATLHFLEDLVQADEIADAISQVAIAPGEHDLMAEVVSRYTRALKPDDLASEQRPRVRHLLEAKLSGEKIKAAVGDVAAEGRAAARRPRSRPPTHPQRRAEETPRRRQDVARRSRTPHPGQIDVMHPRAATTDATRANVMRDLQNDDRDPKQDAAHRVDDPEGLERARHAAAAVRSCSSSHARIARRRGARGVAFPVS